MHESLSLAPCTMTHDRAVVGLGTTICAACHCRGYMDVLLANHSVCEAKEIVGSAEYVLRGSLLGGRLDATWIRRWDTRDLHLGVSSVVK